MKKIFFLFILLMIGTTTVKAEVDCAKLMDVSHSCSGTSMNMKPGDIIDCQITFESQEGESCTKEKLKEMSFKHNISDLTTSNENLNGFDKNIVDGKLEFIRTTGLTEGTLYNYKLTMPEVSEDKDYSISISDILVKNDEDLPIGYNIINNAVSFKVVKPKSTINTLSKLSVSKFNLTPIFSSDILNYTLTVDTSISKVTITAEATNSFSTITGDIGEKTLSYGENTFNVNVKSESGVTKTYKVVVTRQDRRSDENGLSSLTVSGIYFPYKLDQDKYYLDADKDITSVKINSTLIDPKSTYVEGFGNGTKNLVIGTNTFYIKVKAENESIKTYTIVINKTDGKSTVNSLQSLNLVGYKNIISFVPETASYNVTVSSIVEEVEIESKLMSTKSTYVSGFGNRKIKLNVGLNKTEIKVKSEKGDVKTYTLNITREDPKDNNYLKEIKIEDLEIEFEKDVLDYQIDVPFDMEKLVIKTTTEEENTKVNIIGNEKLNVGKNTITIEVVSESGKKKEYRLIAMKREKASNVSKLKNIIIKDHDIDFKSNIYEYVVQIEDDEKSLDIKIEKIDNLSLFSIIGNNNLKSGSKIVINSYAEDGTKTVYTINITKELKFIYPLMGLTLLILIISLTVRRKKNVRIIDKKPIKNVVHTDDSNIVRFKSKVKVEGIPEIDHNAENDEPEEIEELLDEEFKDEEPKFIKKAIEDLEENNNVEKKETDKESTKKEDEVLEL